MEKKFLSKKGFVGDTPYEVLVSVTVSKTGKTKDYIQPSAEITFFGSSGSVTLSFDNWKRDWQTFQTKDARNLFNLIYQFDEALEDAAPYLKNAKKESKNRKRKR